MLIHIRLPVKMSMSQRILPLPIVCLALSCVRQGLHIVRAISGVPIITGVKFQSPAHLCGKLEEGDEIVQVNYQTVVSVLSGESGPVRVLGLVGS